MTKTLSESTNGATEHFGGEFDNRILLRDLPIPPSSNNQYFLHRVGKKTFHIPSGEYKDFKKAMASYALALPQGVQIIYSNRIQNWLKMSHKLHISACFLLEPKRIYTKDGRVKKFDVSNRLKALHDEVAKMLGIDDSSFFGVSAVKMPCTSEEKEMVCIDIAPIT